MLNVLEILRFRGHLTYVGFWDLLEDNFISLIVHPVEAYIDS